MAAQEASSSVGQPRYELVVTDTPKFDLVSYISNYSGRTIFRRLYLIASCSTVLREEATKLAIKEARKASDVQNFYDAINLLQQIPNFKDTDRLADPSWAKEQEKKNASDTHKLENELKGYKNNLIKESIRMGNEDLGSHYYRIGDLGSAVKAYSRMRDYCTAPNHIASTAFRIIAVAIEQRNWLAVQSQVMKIRNLQMKVDDQARTQPKVQAAMGLQQMCSGEYRDAAMSFLNVDSGLGESYNNVLTSNDVAVYGGLCALASMSRSELQSHVLENANFRSFLELEPHIRRAISFFCGSKYSQCLEILESYRADYLLDLYLQPHVSEIYKRVRTKSIVQYFQPFSKVTLDSMGKMFGRVSGNHTTTTTTANGNASTQWFREELISLIESGKLDARIDLEKEVLIAKVSNQRAEMQREAGEMVDKFIREARAKLIRMNALNAGLEVKAPPKKKGWVDVEGAQGWVDDGALGSLGHHSGQGGGRAMRSGR